jgi:hypothetical protein
VTRDPISYVRVEATGNVIGEIGSFAGNEAYRPPREQGYIVVSLPLLKQSRVAISGQDILFGDAETFEIRRYRSDGTLLRVIRRMDSPDPISETDIETVVNARLEDVASDEERMRLAAVYENAPYPSSLPAHGVLATDAEGNLWVEAYRFGDLPRTVEGPRLWSVFSPDGEWLTDVILPNGFSVSQIGADFVLGVRRDELGVEMVEMYSLLKD